ncbi:hypothetical Protein YC6258_04368 [Gynuella sunshinyii YC6258]|uniref:Uncharacterized protein n=1 Tax=Gynuella sunshinyii YC6258 TaxID=1445510 RepID=A0A0C5VAN9_9GAMM|nr:hypothetical Protein YC6258_04368 [Gynuella sunshinyii YC6258]
MPLIVKIVLLVFLGVAVLVWFAERNPVHMDGDKAARYSKWAMILIGLIMVASLVKYCTGH